MLLSLSPSLSKIKKPILGGELKIIIKNIYVEKQVFGAAYSTIWSTVAF